MRLIIVLVPGFSHLSLGALLEPFHTLRNIAPELGIRIELATILETSVQSANGISVESQMSFQNCLKALNGTDRPDGLFLCCGLRTPYKSQGDIAKLLRTCVRARVPLYGLGCSAWKLADAGILSNSTGTVHWSTLAAFDERNPDIEARDALFVTGRNATTSPGEAATLDMVIEFIKTNFSEELAERVCNFLMIGFPRPGDLNQPRDAVDRLRGLPDKLRQMINLMAKNQENPMKVGDIARDAGLSLRQAERLFATHLSASPKKYYIRQRLQHGRLLIEQTSMQINEISIASGFSSRRTFTKYYRNEFGFPPAHTRRTP